MRQVYFDIECASVHKTYAKICVFGYVVCDEEFNILEKEDILINPKGKFELTDRKGEKGITLPYDYTEFKKYPIFPKFYERIKELLEDKDTLVFGHAVLNDVKYLNLETKRFRLPSFNFRFNDSQLIFMTYINDYSHQFGLESIAAKLGVEFTPHRAADDAYATMRVVEAMCNAVECSVTELGAKIGVACGKIENYCISRPQSKGFKRYNSERKKAKEARSQARVKFNNNVCRKRAKRTGKLNGSVFTFARSIQDNIEVSIPFVDKIYELGGKYALRLDDCKIYVEGNDDNSARTNDAKLREGIEVITLAQLEALLND